MSSVCSSRMTRAVTTFSPASIIVANWREKICSAFGLTFLTTAAMPSDDEACSFEVEREQPADAQRLAGGGQVGGVDLARGARDPWR